MFVPVIDRKQHPLMPTTPSRARRWIKSGKVSLHDPQTHKRLTQTAKVKECQPIKLLRWRTWLVPLPPIPTSPAP